MYEKNGEKYYVVDAHVALWDGRESNLKNIHGKQFIDCFYDYHKNLSPEEVVWDYDTYTYYGGDRLMKDLFDEGYVDHAIFQPAHLGDFYQNGFGQTEEAWALTQANPGKLTYNHNFDPRNEQAGLDQLRRDAERFGLKGVKLYTAEWHGDSRGYKLTDPWTYRYLEACEELGITNIHIHKGPTIIPLDRDAFDVADVDAVATDFQGLNFVVEHCGLPRLEDFCWIATQETNVHAGLAVAMPFIHTRPRYFAQIIGELLYWIGEDKIQFSSDYAIWTPKWLVEKFVDFQIPEDMTEYPPLTDTAKKKILGLNAAKMYGLDVPGGAAAARARDARAGPRGRGRGEGERVLMSAVATPAASTRRPGNGQRGRDHGASLANDVLEALATVMDPELDEPITGLGFVRSVALHPAGVTVHLRLPTSFCSPNFAYLMVSDAQDALRRVRGIGQVTVLLDDHHDSDKINAGIAANAGYLGTFGAEAHESLDALRLTFQRKAHTAAMERCVMAAPDSGIRAGRGPRPTDAR